MASQLGLAATPDLHALKGKRTKSQVGTTAKFRESSKMPVGGEEQQCQAFILAQRRGEPSLAATHSTALLECWVFWKQPPHRH